MCVCGRMKLCEVLGQQNPLSDVYSNTPHYNAQSQLWYQQNIKVSAGLNHGDITPPFMTSAFPVAGVL